MPAAVLPCPSKFAGCNKFGSMREACASHAVQSAACTGMHAWLSIQHALPHLAPSGAAQRARQERNPCTLGAGKMAVLEQLLAEILGGGGGERCVVVSNSTKTLDLVGVLCQTRAWSTVRIAGDVCAAKRQDIVTAFNRHGVGQACSFPRMPLICAVRMMLRRTLGGVPDRSHRLCNALSCAGARAMAPECACMCMHRHWLAECAGRITGWRGVPCCAGDATVGQGRRRGDQPDRGKPPGAVRLGLEPCHRPSGMQHASTPACHLQLPLVQLQTLRSCENRPAWPSATCFLIAVANGCHHS